MRGNQRYGRQNYNRDGFRGNFRNQSYERNRSRTYDSKLEVIISKGTMEASLTVDQGQVLEQVPVETGLDVLSV